MARRGLRPPTPRRPARRAGLCVLFVALSGAAHATLPLPDWKDEVVVAAWQDLDERITAACRWPAGAAGLGQPLACDPEKLRAAIAHGEALLRLVSEDGRIHYLIGLAQRHAGDLDAAIASMRRAVALRPKQPGAWADLGDLLVRRSAWTEAEQAYRNVVELVPEGEVAWYGWLQLAQIAAWQHHPEIFEVAMLESLRLGLPLVTVTGNAAWRSYLRDPAMREAVERVVGTYAEPEVLESLRGP